MRVNKVDSLFPQICAADALEANLSKLRFENPPCTILKGALSLRSNKKAEYSKGVLNHDWVIEEDPKDLDYNQQCKKNLFRSTYNRFVVTDQPTPNSTYTIANDGVWVDGMRKEKDGSGIRRRKLELFDKRIQSLIDREDRVKEMYGRVERLLPRYEKNHFKLKDFTESLDKFRPPMPYVSTTKKLQREQQEREASDKKEAAITMATRRTVSQFTDLDGHKRPGCHKWLDESGEYWNANLKNHHPAYAPRQPPFKERLI